MSINPGVFGIIGQKFGYVCDIEEFALAAFSNGAEGVANEIIDQLKIALEQKNFALEQDYIAAFRSGLIVGLEQNWLDTDSEIEVEEIEQIAELPADDPEPLPNCIVCGSDRIERGTGKNWIFCDNCGFQWRNPNAVPFVRPEHPLPIGSIVQQPGGGGGYTGEVIEHHTDHPTAAKVKWHKGIDNVFDDWTNWTGELKPLTQRVPREWWPE